MPSIKMIICTKCGISKPIEEFANRPKRRNRREEQCKECVYNRAKAKQTAHPEAYKLRYDAVNLARKGKVARWYKDNRDKRKAYGKVYYTKNSQKAREKGRKRRALMLGVYRETYHDIDIYERDGWMCGICGQKINKRTKHPDPRSKSSDHIVAISAGGADAPINLQAAHLRCNQGKGTKSGGQLRLIG